MNHKTIDDAVKKHLAADPEVINFWKHYFSTKTEAKKFIKDCLSKLKTRRMMLRVQWYDDIAEDISKVRGSRPALQSIFLFALAESTIRRRISKKEAN